MPYKYFLRGVGGDKYSLLIVRYLIFKKGCTYDDFMKSSEKITTPILASRLLDIRKKMRLLPFVIIPKIMGGLF